MSTLDEKEISIINLLESEKSDLKKETFEDYMSCSESGNLMYQELIDAGMSHRDARSDRRDHVRECRGGTWAWLGVCVGFIGHCD